MIRLSPFKKMSYNEIRDKYLEKLVEYNVVEFDGDDFLRENGENEKSEENSKKKSEEKSEEKSSALYKKLEDFPELRNYLYGCNGKIKKDNLRLILVGPDEAPRSLGGKGEFATMRDVFNKIIYNIEGSNSNISKEAVDVCKKIFKYEQLNIVKNVQEPLAYWLQSQLGVEVCPYCNRIYTTTLYGKKRIRPDFDHFYPHSRYPYLAVSLFNLIPSCNICNKAKFDYAEIKENIEKKSKGKTFTYRQKKSIIYPYDESYNEKERQISFRVISDEKEAFMGQSDNFTIELRPTEHSEKLEFENLPPTKTELDKRFRCRINSNIVDSEIAAEEERLFWERAKHSIELLRLERLYNKHKLEIMKILRIHYEYNRIARQFIMQPLYNFTAGVHTDLAYNRDLQYFACLKQEDWGNSPLNKLKNDIIFQLDELEKTQINPKK